MRLSSDVANAIVKTVPLTKEMNVLDFGCGTGLLSLALLPKINSLTGVDSSSGMLEIFKRKIRDLCLNNATTFLIDPENPRFPPGNYHAIVSNMTFHHIRNIKKVLSQFHEILLPGGYLCISDLDPDEGLFHEDKTGVYHSGFDRDLLSNDFKEVGFENIQAMTASEVRKPVSENKIMGFTIFLLTGRKAGRIFG